MRKKQVVSSLSRLSENLGKITLNTAVLQQRVITNSNGCFYISGKLWRPLNEKIARVLTFVKRPFFKGGKRERVDERRGGGKAVSLASRPVVELRATRVRGAFLISICHIWTKEHATKAGRPRREGEQDWGRSECTTKSSTEGEYEESRQSKRWRGGVYSLKEGWKVKERSKEKAKKRLRQEGENVEREQSKW